MKDSLSYAQRMELLAPSVAGTEILKLAERPEVISFAGGLPDPKSFPVEPIREAMEEVFRDEATAALNYGPSPGYSLLRDWISERMGTHEQVQVTRENILVSSGGVEALTLISMALLDPGDTVIVGAPTYLISLHVFRSFQARIESVRLDEAGIDTDELEHKLNELSAKGVRPKYIYVIPSFQNPSGLTMSSGRREKLIELADRHGIPIVEDHAYADLRFEGDKLPSLKALAPEQVLFIHTFSKIFSPGVRLGWITADAEFITRLGLCKIGTDSCANTLAQRLLYKYGSRGGVDRQVETSVKLYRRKRDRLLAALENELRSKATWTIPSGGFYVWMRLSEGADSEKILRRAIEEQKTAFVAGPPFFADGSGQNHLRLAYSFVPEAQIDEGIHRLAQTL